MADQSTAPWKWNKSIPNHSQSPEFAGDISLIKTCGWVADMGNFPGACSPGRGVTSGGNCLLEDEELWPSNKISVGKGLPIQQNVTAIKIPGNNRNSQDFSSCMLHDIPPPAPAAACAFMEMAPKCVQEENQTRKRHYHYSGLLKSTHAMFQKIIYKLWNVILWFFFLFLNESLSELFLCYFYYQGKAWIWVVLK